MALMHIFLDVSQKGEKCLYHALIAVVIANSLFCVGDRCQCLCLGCQQVLMLRRKVTVALLIVQRFDDGGSDYALDA